MNFESRKSGTVLSWFLGMGSRMAPFSSTGFEPDAEAAKAQRHEDENVMMRVLLNERIKPASKQVTTDAQSLIEVASSLKL